MVVVVVALLVRDAGIGDAGIGDAAAGDAGRSRRHGCAAAHRE